MYMYIRHGTDRQKLLSGPEDVAGYALMCMYPFCIVVGFFSRTHKFSLFSLSVFFPLSILANALMSHWSAL